MAWQTDIIGRGPSLEVPEGPALVERPLEFVKHRLDLINRSQPRDRESLRPHLCR
jgi:hypothetical protein